MNKRTGVLRFVLSASLSTLAISLLCMALWQFVTPFRALENHLGDIRLAHLSPAETQSQRIAVVAINEDTLATLPYRSPIDRSFLASLIQSLQNKGVRAIGVDLLFDQPTELAKDKQLHDTLSNARIPIFVARAAHDAGLTEAQQKFLNAYTARLNTAAVSVLRDREDGVVRRAWTQAGKALKTDTLPAALTRAVGVALPENNLITIAWRGAPGPDKTAFPVYPAHAVKLLPADWFADRIVLIGVDLPLADRHATPIDNSEHNTPGVVIHAHVLSQLLDGRRASALPLSQALPLVLLFALLGALLARAHGIPGIRTLLTLGALGLLWIGAFAWFAAGGPLLPLATPSLALLGTLGINMAGMWRREHRQRRFLRDAFGRYLAPAVVQQLVEHPERLTLDGERREVTFLFSDLAGFTAMTEKLDPHILVELLNGYLDQTCRIALQHGGTVDKIVGDALHVMFNAPLDQPDHRQRAVACALALDAFCEGFRQQYQRQGIPLGITRIGIHTGPVVVGNFGGESRFDYTAHGDAINTAARLESVNKHLGTRICISDNTVSSVEGLRLRPVGELVLKGKTEGLLVHEPLAGDFAEQQERDYKAAYAIMTKNDNSARQAFDALRDAYPDDSLVAFHCARLARGDTGTRVVLKEK
jgi:class 3 adenylate cyclase/CHASE2 domain-containing sensor protein